MKIIQSNKLKKELETETLIIQEETEVKLRATDKSWTKNSYRMIKAVRKQSGEQLVFLTNNFELTTEEITVLYKQRWEIEMFF